ncbi:hypothetical protein FF38_03069 [Lucilia cuprina]|uniref:Uncharacterized protein n=1 Tax=Lucilia cuprina TaxID=7375 RepID=A0A0L0CBZ0_LUCCU|nr:hypothetical protein FF38_03069 [Lucilia cuprina]
MLQVKLMHITLTSTRWLFYVLLVLEAASLIRYLNPFIVGCICICIKLMRLNYIPFKGHEKQNFENNFHTLTKCLKEAATEVDQAGRQYPVLGDICMLSLLLFFAYNNFCKINFFCALHAAAETKGELFLALHNREGARDRGPFKGKEKIETFYLELKI